MAEIGDRRSEIRDRKPGIGGQAAVEFVACLLALLLVITGMIHVANMGRASLLLHARLRGDAGKAAMRDDTLGTLPPYISDWNPGTDGARYTADDRPVDGMAAGVEGTLTEYSARFPGDWTYATAESRLPVSMIHLRESATLLGFAHAEDTVHVALSRVIRQLAYDKKEVVIKEEVWLPLMGGLY